MKIFVVIVVGQGIKDLGEGARKEEEEEEGEEEEVLRRQFFKQTLPLHPPNTRIPSLCDLTSYSNRLIAPTRFW